MANMYGAYPFLSGVSQRDVEGVDSIVLLDQIPDEVDENRYSRGVPRVLEHDVD